MLTEVKLNGTTVNSRLISWETTETFGDEIRNCKIILSMNIFVDIPTLRNGHTITIKRGTTTATDQFVFDGYIDGIDKSGSVATVYGKDKMQDLVKSSVTYSYDGIAFPSTEAKGSDIAKDLIETYAGMTATVVDTGTALTLSKFICNGSDVFERLQKIAELYDYQIYYDNNDQTVHFEPKGYVSNADTLFVGGTNSNVTNIPTWEFDNTQCVNKLTVKGAVQEVQDDEYFSGTGGAGQTFTLSKKPISVQVFDGSTLKVPGVDGSTSGTYDYTVDKENKKITPTSNWTPSNGSDNIKITYVNAIPIPVIVEDTNSQTNYGIYTAEKYFADIQTIEDAETRGNAWLAKYSEPFVSVKLRPASLFDYEAGHKIVVVDIINNENRELVINEIKKTYPHQGDVLSLGDGEWKIAEWGKFTLDRIRKLEEENQKNTDLIVSIKALNHNSDSNSGYLLRKRYTDAYKRSVTGDGFILGNDSYGILGTSKLGDPFGSETLIRRNQGRRKYVEKFYDEDFKNASTTGTWNTTTKTLTI